jgi:hypothetical protein
MTHVKKNAQNSRDTKPSYIECAVQFKNQNPFQTQSFNCKNHNHSNRNNPYYVQSNMGLAEINRYLRYVESMRSICSIFSGRY